MASRSATLKVLSELSDDYRVETDTPSGRRVVAVHGEWQGWLAAAGWGLHSDPAWRDSDLAGRRPLREFEVEGPRRLLVRRYIHGGLLRWLTGERFSDPERPFREILLQRHLESIGVDSPPVLAARALRGWHGFWRLEVVTERLEGTIDLGHVLGMAIRGELEPRVRGVLVEAVGDLLRRLHDGGFLHADLQPNNLLVDRAALDGGVPRLSVLDLDRSTAAGEALSDEQRVANIRRLWRHLERRRREEGPALSRTDLRRFWRGYAPRDGAPRRGSTGEDARWRSLQAALQAEGSKPGGLHAIGWFLERRLGRGTDARARTDGR